MGTEARVGVGGGRGAGGWGEGGGGGGLKWGVMIWDEEKYEIKRSRKINAVD